MVMATVHVGASAGCGKKQRQAPCVCPTTSGPAAPVASLPEPDPAAATGEAASAPPTEADVRAFIENEYLPSVQRLERVTGLAAWNAYVLGKPDFYKAREDAEILYRRFHADHAVFVRVKAMRESTDLRDPLLRRQINLIHLQYLDNQIDPALSARIVEMGTRLEERFNTFRADYRGESKTDNELKEILRNTTDAEAARDAWAALKQVGEQVATDLVALVDLRNEAARQLGYPDYYALQLAINEQTPEQIQDLFDKVAEATAGAHAAMKAELDAELAARFGVAVETLQPWHYADPFFQQAPPMPGLDTDALWAGRDIEKIARDYYAAIGLETEPIFARSDLYEREGKVQHAFCFDIDRSGDVRILLNLKPDAHWADTTLHELGHAVYDVGIDPELPYVLRGSAHTLTTEGIAMMFGGMATNPLWIHQVLGLPADETLDANLRKQRVRDWLIFSRWAMVMTEFERRLYADPHQDLGAVWWEVVERLQGMRRPEGRDAPDWATKIHIVSAPVYYHNYLLGELFSAQLREHVGRTLLNVENVSDVILAGRDDLGPWLVENVFRPGRSVRWEAFVEQVTGRPLGPEAFVAQMR
jgi:peptidyl-dipeptidase A